MLAALRAPRTSPSTAIPTVDGGRVARGVAQKLDETSGSSGSTGASRATRATRTSDRGRLVFDGYVAPGAAGQRRRVAARRSRRGSGRGRAGWLDSRDRCRCWVTALRTRSSQQRGYDAGRHYFRMVIDLDAEPRPPECPKGVVIAPLRPRRRPRRPRGAAGIVRRRVGLPPVELRGVVAREAAERPASTRRSGTWWKRTGTRSRASPSATGSATATGAGWARSACGRLAPAGPRRGAAPAAAFAAFHRRGERPSRSASTCENRTGAVRLYERAGMRVY